MIGVFYGGIVFVVAEGRQKDRCRDEAREQGQYNKEPQQSEFVTKKPFWIFLDHKPSVKS